MLSTAQQRTTDPQSTSTNPTSSRRVLTQLRSVFSSPLLPVAPNQPQLQRTAGLKTSASQDDLALLDKIISDVEASNNRIPTESTDTQTNEVAPIQIDQEDQIKLSEDTNLGSLAQALPTTTLANTDTLNQVPARGSAKEKLVTANVVETNFSSSPAEIELNKEVEMPVEVESYIQEVVNSRDQLPTEIVIADDGADISLKQYPSQPVVVLPISEKIEKEGANKSPVFSVRWLVEFSRKLMKIFSGAVIYKEEE